MTDTTIEVVLPAPDLPKSIAKFKPVLNEEGKDVGLPAHYGWLAREQEAFEAGRGLVFLGRPGVVSVRGPDRLSWLTTLSSQVLTDLVPGESKELMLLDAQGRIEYVLGVVDDGETTWLIGEPEYSQALAEFLKSMQFMLRVEITDVSGDYVAFRTVRNGPGAVPSQEAAAAAPEGTLVWDDPWPDKEVGGAVYFRGVHPGNDAPFRVFAVPETAADEFVDSQLELLGADEDAIPVGLLAAEATRIAAWRPTVRHEVDSKALPAELDWLRTAVHVDKGCYRGQESIARIINLGKPPRRLVFLQLDGSGVELPQAGDDVELDGRKVGTVTSVGEHYEMGPIALALVKRNLDPKRQLKIGEVDAAQELIVPVDGRSDHAPDSRPGAGLKRLDAGKRDIRTSGPGSQR